MASHDHASQRSPDTLDRQAPFDDPYTAWVAALTHDQPVPAGVREAAEKQPDPKLQRSIRVLDTHDTTLRQMFRDLQAASSMDDLPAVLDRVYSALQPAVPFERLGCALYRGEGTVVEVFWVRTDLGPPELTAGSVHALDKTSLATLRDSSEPRILDDLRTYLVAHPKAETARRLVAEGGRASLTCPLRAANRPVGALILTSRQSAAFNAQHAALLRAVSSEAARAIDRAQRRTEHHCQDAVSAALMDALPANVALLDAEGNILGVNESWRAFGATRGAADPTSFIGTNYLDVCVAADEAAAADARAAARGIRAVLNGEIATYEQEYPCHDPDDQAWYKLMANRVEAGRTDAPDARAVVMHVDITERVKAENDLAELAYRDRLTGALSRHSLTQALANRLSSGDDHPASLVVMVDVRDMRDLNEVRGYAAGDRVLRAIHERLQRALAADALIGRVGGDEFVIVAPANHNQPPRAARAAIARVFDAPFDVDGVSMSMAARFGYTRFGRKDRSAEDMVREAEIALAQGRVRSDPEWGQYTKQLEHALRARVEMSRDLRAALANGEFQLHFQPKVALATGEVLACEALLRWDHPRDGLISPARFIPVAEQSQLIVPIGAWVVDEACRCLRAWMDDGLQVVRVAVNVSVSQLSLGGFPEQVQAALEAHSLSPDALTLEITESVFEHRSEQLRAQLEALRAMGVRLSLDDFGTGYSSLLYLQNYAFDEIKVDKGFVQHMLHDTYSHEIVATVIGVARVLAAEVVAEGVETASERDALLAMGGRFAQGFHYSMPLAEEDFRWLLETRRRLPLSAVAGDTDRGGAQ